MGYFQNIHLINYRNFIKSSFDFHDGCNVIIGKNGSGKTNILESISLFEKGRGFRKEKIKNLINFKNQNINFKVNSIFNHEKNNYNISVINEINEEKYKKKILINDSFDSDSIKNFEGLFSIIYFLPEMERLFLSSPLSRRNFIDRLIFSKDKKYNLVINNYKKNIQERQRILKNPNYDSDWIDSIEDNIASFGLEIYKKRIKHLEVINLELKKLDYQKNFSKKIVLKIVDSLLVFNNKLFEIDFENYLTKLKINRKSDIFNGGCTIGPHRSDFAGFEIDSSFNVNQYSTGQQKTVILQIILAHCNFMINHNLKPVILLDEICSHLDADNRELLLYLSEQINMQIFMTGTEKNLFSFLSTKTKYCNIT